MMRKYMRKFIVVIITILTLGMYVPTTILYANTDQVDSSKKLNEDSFSNSDLQVDVTIEEESLDDSWSVKDITNLAKLQTVKKLGPKIIYSVEEEQLQHILNHMELAIENLLKNINGKDLYYIGISEDVVSRNGEQIFTLYDIRSNEELARFDVSRIKRPKDGYWFSFHYHVATDNFTEHHLIGEMFYDKNTPPKWMTH